MEKEYEKNHHINIESVMSVYAFLASKYYYYIQ